jgi:hypothetical protein
VYPQHQGTWVDALQEQGEAFVSLQAQGQRMPAILLLACGQVRCLVRCGVAGVMRGIVLRECVALGIAATEERLTLDDLCAADEVFVTNARIGVVPVGRVGEHSFGMKNPLATRLAAHIEPLDA